MGRGAIPSLRRFARRRMRGSGVVGCYPRFPAAIPEEGAGSPRVTQPFATRFPPRRGAVRLACVRRAASVHPEPGSNSPSKCAWASSPSGPHNCHADRFRSIHMVLFDRKRNSSGPPLGGLAKNESKSDHFKWFDVCPDATHHVCPSSQYPVLKVHALAVHPVEPGRAARRYIARPEGPAGRESGRTHFLHSLGFSAVFTGNREGTSFPRSPFSSIYRNRVSKP